MEKLALKEKIGYALGDGAANIAWRGVATFLFIFYTDVFGINPAAVGLLMLIARFGDGIIDVIMGIICDRTNSKYGKFRPWILWTAIPLGITLSLLFTSPNLGPTGKIIYAYATYLLFFLIYTANNIPYGALMAVMTRRRQRTHKPGFVSYGWCIYRWYGGSGCFVVFSCYTLEISIRLLMSRNWKQKNMK